MNIVCKRHIRIDLNISYLYLDSYTSEQDRLLGKFLIRDISSHWANDFKQWAQDTSRNSNSSNETYQEKEDGYIYIYDALLGKLERSEFYKISTSEFINLLDQWEKALQSEPDIITITQDNESLAVKAETITSNTAKIYRAIVSLEKTHENAKFNPKSFFPSEWTKGKVLQKIEEASHSPLEPEFIYGDHTILHGMTTDRVIIRILYNKNIKDFVTAYPLFPFKDIK